MRQKLFLLFMIATSNTTLGQQALDSAFGNKALTLWEDDIAISSDGKIIAFGYYNNSNGCAADGRQNHSS